MDAKQEIKKLEREVFDEINKGDFHERRLRKALYLSIDRAKLCFAGNVYDSLREQYSLGDNDPLLYLCKANFSRRLGEEETAIYDYHILAEHSSQTVREKISRIVDIMDHELEKRHNEVEKIYELEKTVA